MPKNCIMFVAGEPSGDQNTAPVIEQLINSIPNCKCYGIGGPKMQAMGFISLLPFEEFNKMGYWEVICHLSFFLKAKRVLINEMEKSKPDVLVCVDFSGFNTILMKAAHKMGIPVIWYIAPKFWAWKKKKHTINLKKYTTHIASIFPFETKLLLQYTKSVTFVGNPLVEYIDKQRFHVKTKAAEGLKLKEVIKIAVVPGSRVQEVTKILPVMMSACTILKKKYPNISITVSQYNRIDTALYKKCIDICAATLFTGPLETLFHESDIAIVTSGTATLQAALMCIPMIICYKTSLITYTLGKLLVKGLSNIGLPNIIAEKSIVPELLQHKMGPESIASEVSTYINSPVDLNKTIENLSTLKKELGSKKPSIELTALIKKVLNSNSMHYQKNYE